MSQRTWAGSVLLHASRPSDALSFVQTWLDPRADRGSIPPRGGTAFEPPSPRPLSVERYEQLKDWCLGALPYTAALAAFKLWGNCALACQYLRIGAAVNPIILTKILGRSSKPSSSCPINFSFISYRLYLSRLFEHVPTFNEWS